MGVVVERTEGREVLIGNHTVVGILAVNTNPTPKGKDVGRHLRPRVTLSIESADEIRRVDNAATHKLAAEIKVSSSRVAARRSEPMQEIPIYVFEYEEGDIAGMSLDLDLLSSMEGDMESRKVVTDKDMKPDDPTMLVLRVSSRRDIEVVKKTAAVLTPNLEHRSTTINDGDGMYYMLFIMRGNKGRIFRKDLAV